MFLATGTCVNASDAVISSGSWVIDNYVDDFGDKTDAQYISTISIGEFSNTATIDSKLQVKMLIDYNDPVYPYVRFNLLEYGEIPITYYQGDKINIKIKADDVIYYEDLDGNPPKGDLYKKNIRSSIASGGSELFEVMINELLEKNDIRCIITIGSSEYKFTISANGFREAINSYQMDKIVNGGNAYKYSMPEFFGYSVGAKDGYYIGTDIKELDVVAGTYCKSAAFDDNGNIEISYWTEYGEDVINTLEDGTEEKTHISHGTPEDEIIECVNTYKSYLENELGYVNEADDNNSGVYDLENAVLNLSYKEDGEGYYRATITMTPKEDSND